jgi:hypothetical protein
MNNTQNMMKKALELKDIFNDELDIQGLDKVSVFIDKDRSYVKITLPLGAEIELGQLEETGEQVDLRAGGIASTKGGAAVYFYRK